MFNPDMAIKTQPPAVFRRVIPSGASAFDMRQVAGFPTCVPSAHLAPSLVSMEYLNS